MTHPNLKVTNAYLDAAEKDQFAIITITAVEGNEDNTEVTVCMEGDARMQMRMLCSAQEQLLKSYHDNDEFKGLSRKYLLPVFKGVSSDEQKALMQAIAERVNNPPSPPFWDLMGHLRRFVK